MVTALGVLAEDTEVQFPAFMEGSSQLRAISSPGDLMPSSAPSHQAPPHSLSTLFSPGLLSLSSPPLSYTFEHNHIHIHKVIFTDTSVLGLG